MRKFRANLEREREREREREGEREREREIANSPSSWFDPGLRFLFF